MSTILPIETECSLCGTHSEQRTVVSANSDGLPDLDTRPSEEVRSTISYWVQRCPKCGYCATDISLEYPLADRTVGQPDYHKILRRRAMPEKAREFLAWAMIQAANVEFGGAGWSALHAAWVCDDAEKPQLAGECRRLALQFFSRQRQRAGHITGFEDAGVEELVLADLHRRTGQFVEAGRWAQAGLTRHPEEIIRRGLEMEGELADQKDRAAHSVVELLH